MLLVQISTMLAGGAAVGVPVAALKVTDTTSFCVSCHSMQFPLRQAARSPHFSNASGVQVGCPDCHVPREFLPYVKAKLLAAKDVFHELTRPSLTDSDYTRMRPAWAARARTKMLADDSAACRHCHSYGSFDRLIKAHERAAAEHTTCIVCHYNLVHGETPWPELERGL